jgi:hypothetical protein
VAWHYDPKCCFSVRSAYKVYRGIYKRWWITRVKAMVVDMGFKMPGQGKSIPLQSGGTWKEGE